MFRHVATLGRSGIEQCRLLGSATLFLFHIILCKPRFNKSFRLLIEQLYSVGVLSLPIIIVSALFIGMVVGLQGYNTLEKFASTSNLGQMIALSVARELGPVVAALLFAGRAGSALTAEIGLMQATEQLTSMEMMGVDPIWRVIWPRFWAGFISLPLLSIIFSAVAVYGGYVVGVVWLGIDSGTFWNNMQSSVNFRVDIFSGMIKGITFGFIVTWISVYQGFTAKPTSAGIARSTTRTVVYASLAVLFFDFILTTMMIRGW